MHRTLLHNYITEQLGCYKTKDISIKQQGCGVGQELGLTRWTVSGIIILLYERGGLSCMVHRGFSTVQLHVISCLHPIYGY